MKVKHAGYREHGSALGEVTPVSSSGPSQQDFKLKKKTAPRSGLSRWEETPEEGSDGANVRRHRSRNGANPMPFLVRTFFVGDRPRWIVPFSCRRPISPSSPCRW